MTNNYTLEELKAAAFEALLLNPGVNESEWTQILMEEYGMEVVDAYGDDINVVRTELAKLWLTSFCDGKDERTFQEWAAMFPNDASLQSYYDTKYPTLENDKT